MFEVDNALGEFTFIDDNRIVVWNHNTINGTASDDVFTYAKTDKLECIGHQELPVFDVLNGVSGTMCYATPLTSLRANTSSGR
jgi:hypothetical protein